MYVSISKLVIVLQTKENHTEYLSQERTRKKRQFLFFRPESFSITLLAKTFKISFLVWLQLEPERHIAC